MESRLWRHGRLTICGAPSRPTSPLGVRLEVTEKLLNHVSGSLGGIVAVSPGKGGFGSFSPPLDPAGNSVRGVLAARYLSERLGLDLFVSAPAD